MKEWIIIVGGDKTVPWFLVDHANNHLVEFETIEQAMRVFDIPNHPLKREGLNFKAWAFSQMTGETVLIDMSKPEERPSNDQS